MPSWWLSEWGPQINSLLWLLWAGGAGKCCCAARAGTSVLLAAPHLIPGLKKRGVPCWWLPRGSAQLERQEQHAMCCGSQCKNPEHAAAVAGGDVQDWPLSSIWKVFLLKLHASGWQHIME